jgi:hypothetical protein
MRNLTLALCTFGMVAGAGALTPNCAEAQVAAAQQAPDSVIDARLDRFNQFLNLSPDQQAKVRPILESEHRKLTELAGQDGPKEHKVEALQAIGNETDRKVKEVLTPDQLKLFSQSKSLLRPQLPAAALGS